MYMVSFTSDEGKPGYHWEDSLEDAVRFVERLRNNEGVTDTKVYQTTEVPLEVKAYFKVEVAGPSQASPSSNGGEAVESPSTQVES
jgi:hypothetical protein